MNKELLELLLEYIDISCDDTIVWKSSKLMDIKDKLFNITNNLKDDNK